MKSAGLSFLIVNLGVPWALQLNSPVLLWSSPKCFVVFLEEDCNSSHQVQCNIPIFEALLRKYKYLLLERCRKSNNVWLRALMQSDCLYSSPAA